MARSRIEYKTPEQFAHMRAAGLLVDRLHDEIQRSLQPGMTTGDLDRIAAEVIADGGGTPNFLGYQGFPATICVSVNEEIVHGIPGDRVINDGDLVSVDAGCIINGWHSDAARTHIAGTAKDPEHRRLIDVAEAAMWDGIAAAATGRTVDDIGAAVEDSVLAAVGERFQHLEDFGGHGIGSAMHQPPDVMNFRTRGRHPKLKPGMAMCVEPMLTIGSADCEILDDDWTVVTLSGAVAAHVEHAFAILEDGIFVLTAADGGREQLGARGVEIAAEPVL
ncbi:type I methionyl aminopeptidase [Helcobacillus massiliensis]|uniref:Methionine aminopeptidase n=1 Tax=Helcobacillus massiliensis TaxID=521392 RepID=A0A839R2B9_9MICO|nr:MULTISPECIES: type I methionyl aminopeptidase [Helcobacillus]MBB3022926.1 methionyl aminopeptidase [Helcobacillus massiliensis]MCG7426224.1 type I methionyl aminopeptidase [Helcobacillus sp. ACRRO]MCT1558564.1 type I methionyl aminopeptidase [Helcobacillus massiliensis]MCT2037214.1 type I methionyl aminopeptidase [Helcobacillus massiliensis]MCT2332388.1 type I methionyl aminopeptidase [Helcobacillus massiliensis]